MKFKKILKKLLNGFFNIKGFGILEMSIAGIIGASLTGSIVQVTQKQQENQNKMEIQFDMMEATIKVSELLSDPSSCENSLKGFNVNSPAGAITSLKTKFNKVLYNTTDIYGNQSFKIKSIGIKNNDVPPDSGGEGRVNILVAFEKLKYKEKNSDNISTKVFDTFVTTDANLKILNCYGDNDGIVESVFKESKTELENNYNDSETDYNDLVESVNSLVIKNDLFDPTMSINGGWSDWSGWSACNANCGEGKISRTRECNNPTPRYGGNDCDGLSIEEKSCTRTHVKCGCPLPGYVSGGIYVRSEQIQNPWHSCSNKCDCFDTRYCSAFGWCHTP
jgi:hypothetical protein